MTNEEKRKIADIVEAFWHVNNDIYGAYNKLTDLFEEKRQFDTEKWKKYEKNLKQTRDYYYDYDIDDWFDDEDKYYGKYYLHTYGEYKGKVVGFTFVISVDYEKEVYRNGYEKFIELLDQDLNKFAPMLLIYGVYEPVSKRTKRFQIVNDDYYTIVDEIIGLQPNWQNYDKNKIGYDEELDVQIDYLDEDGNVADGFEGWYKRARVKILQIQDIDSPQKAQEIIDDLLEMAKGFK